MGISVSKWHVIMIHAPEAGANQGCVHTIYTFRSNGVLSSNASSGTPTLLTNHKLLRQGWLNHNAAWETKLFLKPGGGCAVPCESSKDRISVLSAFLVSREVAENAAGGFCVAALVTSKPFLSN